MDDDQRASVDRIVEREAARAGGDSERRVAVLNDDALNAVLDRLDAAGDRHAQRDALRRWIAELRRTWEAERIERHHETLGKLGGGGQ